jgi:hypothetical protein
VVLPGRSLLLASLARMVRMLEWVMAFLCM